MNGDQTTDSGGDAVVIRQVSKSFDTNTVLSGVSFVAPRGKITVVLGPSGEGKTTLLRMIAGFERPDTGQIWIDGRLVADDHTNVRPDRRGVGFVPQDGALFPHLDVAGNVGFGLERSRSQRVGEMLHLVGLAGFEARRTSQLSGGQQQRVALARALAPSPSVVLLDEPFSSLDATMRHLVRDEVASILRRSAASALLVTHDQQEAMSMADHMVVVLDGKVAQEGSPSTIYDSPATLDVARFIGDTNVLRAVVGGGEVRHGLGGSSTTVADGPAVVVVRPEHLRLVAADIEGVATGVIGRRTYFGRDATVEVELATGETVIVRVDAAAVIDVGDTVGVVVDGRISVFAD